MTVTLEHVQPDDWAALNRVIDKLRSLTIDTGGRTVTVRWGVVAADGTIIRGSGGFTVTKTGTGTYSVAQVMPTAPTVTVTAGDTGGAYSCKALNENPTGFDVTVFNTTSAADMDGKFHWIAVG